MKTQSEIVVAGLGTWASHLLTNPCKIKARSNTHKVRWLRACAFIAQSVLGHIEAKICLEEEGRIQFNTADKKIQHRVYVSNGGEWQSTWPKERIQTQATKQILAYCYICTDEASYLYM